MMQKPTSTMATFMSGFLIQVYTQQTENEKASFSFYSMLLRWRGVRGGGYTAPTWSV